jgi:hypothetical protein
VYFVERKVKKQQVVHAVLAEQNKQRRANIYDPEAIAEAERRHARPAQELAYKLGILDARFAKDDSWIKRVGKQWAKVIPGKFKSEQRHQRASVSCRSMSSRSCADSDLLRYDAFSGQRLVKVAAV